MTRVLVVAGIRLYREGLEAIIARDIRLSVAGTAADVPAACGIVSHLRPEVVLLDAAPEAPPQAVRALVASSPDVRILVLGLPEADLDHQVLECVQAGAAGYVTREASLADLVEAVVCAARGEMLCSKSVAGALARSLARIAAETESPPADTLLTRREHQIAHLLADGLSNKEIARDLHIELPTVKNHVHRILGKLQVRRRGEAAARLRGVRVQAAVHSTRD